MIYSIYNFLLFLPFAVAQLPDQSLDAMVGNTWDAYPMNEDSISARALKDPVDASINEALEKLYKQDPKLKEAEQANELAASKEGELESVSGGTWKGTNVSDSSNSPLDARDPGFTHVFKRSERGLMSCLQKNRVEFIAQGDAKYNELSTPYNTRIRTRPRIIITPNRVSDIQYAVVCAQREGFKVQPRAGGHSYAGYSTGDANTLIIDLRYISNVEYDPRSRKAFAFGGARLGNLGLKLGADGKAISHGDCPGVGLAGHSLHGGFGYTSRMWGLSTDHILSMKVVTATGDLVSASPKLNSDLFYAMKGAGDSFGIAVEFELKTRTVPDKVLRFIFDLARYSRDAKRMADVFVNVQACVQSRSFGDNYGLTIRLATDAFRVAGYFYGKEADFQRTMLPCLSKAAPVTITIEEQSFSRSLSSIAGDAPLRRFIDAPGAKSNFYAKSVMIPEQRPLNKAQMQDYFRTVLEAGARVPNQFVITFRLMGGTGSHVKKDYGDTSIPWRDTLWIAQHDGQTQRNPRDVARAITAMNDQLEGSIQRNVATYFMFPPFIDPDLTREESHKMYLGDEHSRRLQRIKTKWDPTNVFSNPQSVQLERRR